MKITIIGSGINGLVAANYLQRNGFQVTIVERKARMGGAVSTETFTYEGKKCEFPNGASVFGFMQDFVFQENFHRFGSRWHVGTFGNSHTAIAH